MKKTILMTTLATGMLFATNGTVTDLTTNINNEINNGISPVINNSEVIQGHTTVSGNSDISTLDITQTENVIGDVGIDSAIVTQGRTQINAGTVTDSKLNSNNSIKESSITTNSTVNQASTIVNNASLTETILNSTNTILEASVTSESTVNQGLTIVNDGAEVENTEVTSTNGLLAIVENGSNVSQATLELNGENSELNNNSVITTENTIIANIDASEVHQARVRIGGGYTVSTLIMNETNTLLANVTGGSSVIQGGLDVCAIEGAGDASDWCEE